MPEKDPLDGVFLEHLTNLDAAPIAPTAMFESDQKRERYESLITFAYLKYSAAKYHLERVQSLLREEDERTEAALLKEISPKKSAGHTYSSGVLRDSPVFGHELVAFLAAIKSGLDFLATAASMRFKGIQCDSIRTFIKRADQGKCDPFSECVKEHLEWLKDLRDYRHHLLHRLVLPTQTGGRFSNRGLKSAKTTYPVVVPSKTPKGFADTRKAKLFEATLDDIPRIDTSESYGYVTYPNGRKEILLNEIGAKPAQGYEEIGAFTDRHCKAFAIFFADCLHLLQSENFASKWQP